MSSETASWPEHPKDARSRMIVLVRHEETALNVEKRFRGRADPPLTPRGREQAGCLEEALGSFEPSLSALEPSRASPSHGSGLSGGTRV
ncbi:MAG TPA: histidine phosphatase family protein [Polyangiaceae bacterium]|nr:histidine phosphatase family protein [Polyangiaceae bacterium]